MNGINLEEMEESNKEISGYVHIGKRKRLGEVSITSNSNFFSTDESVIIRVDHEKIMFKKPTMDYRGRTYKPKKCSRANTNWIAFTLSADLPIGNRLEFDLEESNFDQCVVYYQ